MYKTNYGHQYTADAVLSFKFLRRAIENGKNILNYCYKNVSFALHNGWNVTKTSFDNAWAGMILSLIGGELLIKITNGSPHLLHPDPKLVFLASMDHSRFV